MHNSDETSELFHLMDSKFAMPPASLVRAAQRQIISMFAPNYCALQMEGKKEKKTRRKQNPLYCVQKSEEGFAPSCSFCTTLQ